MQKVNPRKSKQHPFCLKIKMSRSNIFLLSNSLLKVAHRSWFYLIFPLPWVKAPNFLRPKSSSQDHKSPAAERILYLLQRALPKLSEFCVEEWKCNGSFINVWSIMFLQNGLKHVYDTLTIKAMTKKIFHSGKGCILQGKSLSISSIRIQGISLTFMHEM